MLYNSALVPLLALGGIVTAAPSLEARRDDDVWKFKTQSSWVGECKTCPELGCPNGFLYNTNWNGHRDNVVNATCWTLGTSINNNAIWLGTKEKCYTHSIGLQTGGTDLKSELPFCGVLASDTMPTLSVKTKYKSDCLTTPLRSYDIVRHYEAGVELDITCYYDEKDSGGSVLGDITWYRTKHSYCFIPKASVDHEDTASLPWCGPRHGLSYGMFKYASQTASKAVDASEKLPETGKNLTESDLGAETQGSSLQRRTVYEDEVIEDDTACYAASSNSSDTIIHYSQGEKVLSQCIAYGQSGSYQDKWIFTAEDCYVPYKDIKPISTPDGLSRSYRECKTYNETTEYDPEWKSIWY